MSWFARFRNVLQSNKLSADLDRELAFHLEERIDELVAGGMDPAAARLEAQRRFGNYSLQKENTRERDVFVWFDTLLADLRYTMRGLRAAPGFALVAILSLALGIGANTAIFTLINSIMLKSLPVRHPEELIVLTMNERQSLTHALWERIQDRQDLLGEMAAFASTGIDLSNGGEARPTSLALVSGGFFSLLGVRPAVGRTLVAADDRSGCPATAVISHAFWHSEYGGNPNVVGKSVSLDGQPFRIVGVTESAFFGLEFGYQPPIWVPLCGEAIIRGGRAAGYTSRMGRIVVGRTKPGVMLEQVRDRLVALGPSLIEATQQFAGSSKGIKQSAEQYRKTTFGAVPFSKGIQALSSSYGKALF
ncbi:MAG: ABC transporter permease, partial [Longimicrobiales bacterium]